LLSPRFLNFSCQVWLGPLVLSQSFSLLALPCPLPSSCLRPHDMTTFMCDGFLFFSRPYSSDGWRPHYGAQVLILLLPAVFPLLAPDNQRFFFHPPSFPGFPLDFLHPPSRRFSPYNLWELFYINPSLRSFNIFFCCCIFLIISFLAFYFRFGSFLFFPPRVFPFLGSFYSLHYLFSLTLLYGPRFTAGHPS